MFSSPNYNYGYPWNSYGQNLTQIQSQQQSNGINWVQGEAGAKSFHVDPNQSVLLMDSENNVFYIKSSDVSGMPMPLRIFDYTERIIVKTEPVQEPKVDYVTREEFEKRIAEITTDAKQRISTTK